MEEEFDNQGKRPDQLEKSGKIIFYAFILAVVFVLSNCIFNFM